MSFISLSRTQRTPPPPHYLRCTVAVRRDLYRSNTVHFFTTLTQRKMAAVTPQTLGPNIRTQALLPVTSSGAGDCAAVIGPSCPHASSSEPGAAVLIASDN